MDERLYPEYRAWLGASGKVHLRGNRSIRRFGNREQTVRQLTGDSLGCPKHQGSHGVTSDSPVAYWAASSITRFRFSTANSARRLPFSAVLGRASPITPVSVRTSV